LVSLETWHIRSEDSPTGGEEELKREEQVGELGNMARHKRGLTSWRGKREERHTGRERGADHDLDGKHWFLWVQ
jgi:hypothetical protein